MWLLFGFLSAALLGFYDVFKKASLRDNAVLPVLFLNTLFSSLLFLPLLALSASGVLPGSNLFYVPPTSLHEQLYILFKALIVLGSWLGGYFAIKHLPLTLVGPINATRPVMVLLGALLIYGENLNLYQWTGVLLAILSLFLLSRSGRKEGINFRHNRWILCLFLAALLGAFSGLYDKYLIAPPTAGGVGLDRMVVQTYYNFYQCLLMGLMLLLLWWPTRTQTTPFRWRWTILGISLFLSAADLAYLYALSHPGALISVVSMVRRSSVLVSFGFGALVFGEKNLRGKAIDLLLVLLGMLFLYLGSR